MLKMDFDIQTINNYIMNWMLIAGLYFISVTYKIYHYIQTQTTIIYNRYLKPCYFTYRGIQITTNNPHVRPSFEVICKSPKFIQWLNRFSLDKFNLVSINITDVDFFSRVPQPEKLGFLKFTCEVYTKDGDPIDGIVFLRGDSAGIMIIPEDEDGNQYVLLTEQPRIPTGGFKEEIVAGMFDSITGETVLNEVIRKEISEETGLVFDSSDPTYQPLGRFTLSGGGCDENIHLAVWRPKVSSAVMKEMMNTMYGEKDSNEKINIKIYDYSTFCNELGRIGDAKTSLSWYLQGIIA